MLKGIGVSAGIGLAPAVVLAVSELVIPTAKPADLEAEKAAFWAAHAKVLSDTHALAEKTAAEIGPDEAAVLDDQGLAEGWGLLDTGTGSLEKVEIRHGRLIQPVNEVQADGSVNMPAFVLAGGRRYAVRGDVLEEA